MTQAPTADQQEQLKAYCEDAYTCFLCSTDRVGLQRPLPMPCCWRRGQQNKACFDCCENYIRISGVERQGGRAARCPWCRESHIGLNEAKELVRRDRKEVGTCRGSCLSGAVIHQDGKCYGCWVGERVSDILRRIGHEDEEFDMFRYLPDNDDCRERFIRRAEHQRRRHFDGPRAKEVPGQHIAFPIFMFQTTRDAYGESKPRVMEGGPIWYCQECSGYHKWKLADEHADILLRNSELRSLIPGTISQTEGERSDWYIRSED